MHCMLCWNYAARSLVKIISLFFQSFIFERVARNYLYVEFLLKIFNV